MRKLCNEMKVEIIEAEACPDHIHMLVSIPPYMSVAQFMGTLKSKSVAAWGHSECLQHCIILPLVFAYTILPLRRLFMSARTRSV